MSKVFSNSLPWATIFLCLLTIFYAVAGFVEVIRGAVTFEDYGKFLSAFAIGLGVLGIGRGIAANK